MHLNYFYCIYSKICKETVVTNLRSVAILYFHFQYNTDISASISIRNHHDTCVPDLFCLHQADLTISIK